MVVGQVTGLRRCTEEVAGRQPDAAHLQTRLPLVVVLDVRRHRQDVVLIANAQISLVVDVAELSLAAGHLRQGAVQVVVVLKRAIVDHGTDVRVLVLR